MRTLVALALVLAACGPDDRADVPAANDALSSTTAGPNLGPDPLALRIPRAGGIAEVRTFGEPDSVVWRSSQRLPPVARVLGFDEHGGSIAYVDRDSLPGRIDLRLGGVTRATRTKLASLASADGWAIFGITNRGVVTRLTPTGDWTVSLPGAASAVFPQPDGSLLALAQRGDSTVVWRLIPPEGKLLDTAVVPLGARSKRVLVGDRLYFAGARGLVGLRGRDLEAVPRISVDDSVTHMVSTPSGDRVYASTGPRHRLVVVDRYRERVHETIRLPGPAAALRMDPLGRFVLARMAGQDSAWVIAIDTDRVVGAVRTDWRADLPAVVPDGSIALAVGGDVVLVSGRTLEQTRVISGGAKDHWYFFTWNGFRPRAAGLDQPVVFSDAPTDTVTPLEPSTDSALVLRPPPGPDTVTRQPRPPSPFATQTPRKVDSAAAVAPGPNVPVSTPQRFFVSFAALLSEERARDLARGIRVDGQSAHVLPSPRGDMTVYRVVMGPYSTRQEADRVGRAAGHSFWVFEETP